MTRVSKNMFFKQPIGTNLQTDSYTNADFTSEQGPVTVDKKWQKKGEI